VYKERNIPSKPESRACPGAATLALLTHGAPTRTAACTKAHQQDDERQGCKCRAKKRHPDLSQAPVDLCQIIAKIFRRTACMNARMDSSSASEAPREFSHACEAVLEAHQLSNLLINRNPDIQSETTCRWAMHGDQEIATPANVTYPIICAILVCFDSLNLTRPYNTLQDDGIFNFCSSGTDPGPRLHKSGFQFFRPGDHQNQGFQCLVVLCMFEPP
jgi:hypothetical protein